MANVPLTLAYLVNVYPSVSHTFVRRELRAVEALGHRVLRYSIRAHGPLADPADREEAAQTQTVLAQPKAALILSAAGLLLARPGRALHALRILFAMHRRSERGLLRHLAYLIEAAWLVRRWQRDGVQHVHVHFGSNGAAVARLARALGGPPYSVAVHGPDEFDAPIGMSLGDKIHDSAFFAAITSFCSAQLKRWARYEDWPKIQIVRCTVGPEWFDAATPLDENAGTLVCVGRLSEQKGHLVLIEAFAQLAASHPAARLVLVGDGPLRGAIEARARELRIAERVTITGWQSEAEVRAHLLAARALVMASFAEGLPMVIMEAFALQRPVVATAINGIPELVCPGENGWLAIAGDADSLASALRGVLDTPADELRVMAQRGQARVRERHASATEAAKLAALIAQSVEATK